MAFAIYARAALGEIAGCFSFWAWQRLDCSALWVLPGLASLAAFASPLIRVDVTLAGRAYAAYGGIYIATSLLWFWAVEGQRPDAWDGTGAALALCGATVILVARHKGVG